MMDIFLLEGGKFKTTFNYSTLFSFFSVFIHSFNALSDDVKRQ